VFLLSSNQLWFGDYVCKLTFKNFQIFAIFKSILEYPKFFSKNGKIFLDLKNAKKRKISQFSNISSKIKDFYFLDILMNQSLCLVGLAASRNALYFCIIQLGKP
jgi:hypothetical protein